LGLCDTTREVGNPLMSSTAYLLSARRVLAQVVAGN
jgi:hypothetical protein